MGVFTALNRTHRKMRDVCATRGFFRTKLSRLLKRAGRLQSQQMSIWTHLFSWEDLFGWQFVGWAEGILIGGAMGLIGIGFAVPSARNWGWFTGAQICCLGAALIFLVKIGEIAVATKNSFWERTIFVALLFGFVGVATVEVVRRINRIRPGKHLGVSSATDRSTSSELHIPPPVKPRAGGAPPNKSGPLSPTVETNPIGNLARLGWGVKDDRAGIIFEIVNKPLPNVKESAGYFMALRKPFRLQLQQVPSIAGLKYLAGISDCVELSISASNINDLSELRVLKSLRKLDISQTPFTVRSELIINALASLVNLETLNLNMSRVSNLEPLRGLTKLVSLNIGGTLVRDLSPIKGLTLLKSLDVRDSSVTDMSALDADNALEELSVDEKQVPSLTHLSRLTKLSKLSIIAQVPVDIAAVGTLSNLKSLFIWGPPLIDLSPLRKLGKLTNLQVSGLGFTAGRSRVVDVDAIGELAQIRTLTFTDVQIDSLRFLARCSNLVELNLQGVPVRSLTDLANLASLKRIYLVDVPIVDISPLLSLPNLETLSLLRTPARADVISELQRRGVKVTIN